MVEEFKIKGRKLHCVELNGKGQYVRKGKSRECSEGILPSPWRPTNWAMIGKKGTP